ncbi:MAG: NUDIX hydrolase [Oscillospiraceae bacterium]|nr:NUDIX hydrolase [Oscillospiraceae bacterium]
MDLTEKTIESRTVYDGRIITVQRDAVLLPDGAESVREVVRSSGAAVILPVSEDDTVTLVRQYRYAAGEHLLEAPAGKLEPGEDPAAAAARELKEETGWTAGTVVPLGSVFASPGHADERLHLFLALDVRRSEACPDAGEFVETVDMSLDELVRQVISGSIIDAKTVCLAFLAREYLIKEGRR